MFRRSLISVWIGILVLSGMFLMGQEAWPPCTDLDGDEYGNPASALCRHPDLDCDDSNADRNPGVPEDCADGGIDNDCDGLADHEDSDCDDCSDGFEPNETCDEYFPLGTVFEDDTEQLRTARIYPAADEDTFRFFAEENLYHLCDFQHEQDFSIRVRMVPTQGTPCKDYDLYLYDESCNLLQASTRRGCEEESITFRWDVVCGVDDSRYFRIRVSGYDGSYDCGDYELYLDMWRSW